MLRGKQFYNPFHELVKKTPHRPWFKGFFRAMPLHRWSLQHAEQVLEYAARHPSYFGLPNLSTCIVNTAHLLPSTRSRSSGVWVFGTERGCKSLVIPRSFSAENFDVLDAKLVESIFKWNPGMEYIYLSKSCQGMFPQLTPHLTRMRNLSRVTLEGWDDPVAIHKVGMACKHLEVLDLYTFDQAVPNWRSEVAVQAITTLIEMHQKLRCVEASRNLLEAWCFTTNLSRCKHNVALVPATCTFSLCYGIAHAVALLVVSWVVYRACVRALSCIPDLHNDIVVLSSFVVAFFVFVGLLVDDHLNRHRRGRGWTVPAKLFLLLRRRVALARRGPTGVVKV